jgi:hypothetical protein
LDYDAKTVGCDCVTATEAPQQYYFGDDKNTGLIVWQNNTGVRIKA